MTKGTSWPTDSKMKTVFDAILFNESLDFGMKIFTILDTFEEYKNKQFFFWIIIFPRLQWC